MDTPVELLTQALLGELSEERKRCFEAWLQESEDHRLLWEKFRQKGYFENTLSELHAVDAEGAYREFLRNRKRYRVRKLMKYAAILLPFAFLMGWAARQAFRTNETVNLPVVEQITHGKVKAQLFLSDGTKCNLGESDCQLNEGQVNVVVSGGKLQYENKAGEAEEEMKYNVLVVPRGGEYTLALSDGTIVNLNSGSELKYPVLFTGDTRTVRVSGEAYFEVAEDAAHPFIVETRGIEVKVLGTGFNVMAYPDDEESAVTLVHGKVGIQTDRQQLILQPDEQYVYQLTTQQGTVRKVDASQYVSWREGILNFDQMPLDELARKLGRWYDVEFFFASEQLKQLKFSGAFKKYNDLYYVLNLIEELTDVRFAVNNRTVIVNRK
mgnify:CR=1 FL=1